MNRLLWCALLAVAVAAGWAYTERSRRQEDERLADALAKAVELASTRVNPAYLQFERRYRRPPADNAEAGLPPPQAWAALGYDGVRLYPNGDVRFEIHRSGAAPYAFVWRSQAVVPTGSVSCAVRGVPVRVLQHMRMTCNVEFQVNDGSQSTDALPPVPRAPAQPADLVLEAVSRDDAVALEGLKQGGASLCEADADGRIALAEAARGEQSRSFALLLVSGCPLDAIEPATGKTALMAASAAHELPAAEALLQNGASPTLADAAGDSAWFLLGTSGYAVPGADLHVRQTMLDKGAGIDAVDAHGQTILMQAAANGSGDLVEWLLAHGARLDLQDAGGRSALMHAVTGAQGERVLPLLLEHGPNLKLADRDGMTAIALADGIPDPARRQRVLWVLARH